MGIEIGDFILSILLYADDIAIIAANPEDLQLMFDTVQIWLQNWRLTLNGEKTNVIHFRSKKTPPSPHVFYCGPTHIKRVESYPYLGFVFHEHNDLRVGAQALADSASKALSGILTKTRKLGGLGYKAYSQLFHSGVASVMDYSGGIWGFKDFSCINVIQRRAIRAFMAVGKYTSNLAIESSMGWLNALVRRQKDMVRIWNRIQYLPDDRLPKKVMDWDHHLALNGARNWSWHFGELMTTCGHQEVFEYEIALDKSFVQRIGDILLEKEKMLWVDACIVTPKLQTYYSICGPPLESEMCLLTSMPRIQRSVMSRIMCGSSTLEIEKGRHLGIPRHERHCTLCNNDQVEDEIHFTLRCPMYDDLRYPLIQMSMSFFENFLNLSYQEQLRCVFQTDALISTAAICFTKMFHRRKNFKNAH